ncbi:MAG: cupin domain-containing protein [Ignavibacteriaceae bacterium]
MEENIKVINTGNAEHYNWGNMCDGWHLLKREELSIIREKMPPGTSEVKHYHEKSLQFFFILSGEASMEVQDKRFSLHSFDGIEIPPLIAHKISNESNQELNFIVVSNPKSHGDRIPAEESGF